MKNKILVLLLLFGGTVLFGAVDKAAGEVIFTQHGCTMCHAKDVDTIGPSIRTISLRYSGDENGLVAYLKGHGKAIVYPEREGMMRPQLLRIANLYEDEHRSLARYMIQAFMRIDF